MFCQLAGFGACLPVMSVLGITFARYLLGRDVETARTGRQPVQVHAVVTSIMCRRQLSSTSLVCLIRVACMRPTKPERVVPLQVESNVVPEHSGAR